MNFTASYRPQPGLSPLLKKAGLGLVLFLCVFIPFRSPLADLTFSGIKALPDVLILALAAWYCVSVRFRLRFLPQDWVFLAFELWALLSTAVFNGLSPMLWVYEARSIGVYYVLYFVIRNFGYGKKELGLTARVLQGTSLPLLALALVEKVSSKTLLFSKTVLSSINSSDNFGRVYSMFYNPNTYGLFLTLVIVLSLWLGLRKVIKTPVWMYACLALSLYLTMSRSSMMILGLALLVLLVTAAREKAVRWKKLGIHVVIIAAAVFAAVQAAGWGAGKYYDARAKYLLMDRIREGSSQAAYITPVTYTTPQGEDKTGYVFYDITYLDKECTQPLNEYGTVVHTKSADYILTSEGGMKVEEFNALPEDRQAELLRQDSAYRDVDRDNKVLEDVRSSLDMSASTRFNEMKEDKMLTADYNGRLFAVKKAAEIVADHPLTGAGIGTFGSAASLTWTPPTLEQYELRESFYADNQYACVLAETGAVGMILFLLFLFGTLWHYRKSLLQVLVCCIIGWFGLFYNILEVQIGAFLLWSILSFWPGRASADEEASRDGAQA